MIGKQRLLIAKLLLLCSILLGAVQGEIFSVRPGETLTITNQTNEGDKIRFIFLYVGEHDMPYCQIKVYGPTGNRLVTFDNETSGDCYFISNTSGKCAFILQNHGETDAKFNVKFSDKKGSFVFLSANDKEALDPLEEFSKHLNHVISAQLVLLDKQKKHEEKKRNIKSWIKRVAGIEIAFCLLILYYLQNEMYRTLYNKKRF